MRNEAVKACRQWARVRELVIVYSERGGDDVEEEVEAFDRTMFALGAVAYTAEGDVLGVSGLDDDGTPL